MKYFEPGQLVELIRDNNNLANPRSPEVGGVYEVMSGGRQILVRGSPWGYCPDNYRLVAGQTGELNGMYY